MDHLTRRDVLQRGALAALMAPHLPRIVRSQIQQGGHTAMTTVPSTNSRADAVTLRDVWPDRSTYRPGEPASIRVALANSGSTPRRMMLDVRLSWLDEERGTQQHHVDAPPGALTLAVPVSLPPAGFRGYGVDLTLRDEHGR